MTLKKSELELTFNVLKETTLNLSDARIRDNFLKPVGEALDQLNKEKSAIYLEYCDKDEDGNPEITDDKYHFESAALETGNSELKILYAEEIEIPLANQEKIKEFFESTAYAPKLGEIDIIDDIIAKL